MSDNIHGPWVSLGDYNTVFETSHRLRGVEISKNKTRDGNEYMFSKNIRFLRSFGHFYSWHSLVEGKEGTCSRIDHFFINEDRMMQFPNSVVQYLNPGLSDHSPMLSVGGGRPF